MTDVEEDPRFSPQLYEGTADAYDRFRLGYPAVVIQDMIDRVRPSGDGRLLDLGCGTGQLAFSLIDYFAETWAVDQEPDMVRVVGVKAADAHSRVRPVLSAAEDLDAPAGYFDLVVIGNAFHRLRRALVARQAHGWLRAGGHLALCWSDAPLAGSAPWQETLSEVIRSWKTELGAEARVPAEWEDVRRRRTDADVLVDAGFTLEGKHSFVVEHRWSVDELIGFVHSTSFLPRGLLGHRASDFAADLAAQVSPKACDGELIQSVRFAYELARA